MSNIVEDRQIFPHTRETFKKYDVADHPTQAQHEASPDVSQKIFATMKYEINRLNSFKNKWPLDFIKPKDLADAGFFYLQTEDKVQCAFCHVTIFNWSVNDRPLREHIKTSPKCPFLNSRDVGNVPVFQQSPLFGSALKTEGKNCLMVSTSSYKPKHPRMADARRRLMTYKDWPLATLNPEYLTKCGLYYTGVADVVICFFCGGSLGNWEPNDDPLVEHTKFFPDCAFLALAKSAFSRSEPNRCEYPKMTECSVPVHLSKSAEYLPNLLMKIELRQVPSSEIVKEACEIFPESLVLDVVSEHIKKTGQNVTSLHDLCEEILEYKAKKERRSQDGGEATEEKKPKIQLTNEAVEKCTTEARSKRDTLLCKICMDQEMGVVFQPCGHLVACQKCSREVSNCPLCRRPITNTVRTYLS